MLLIQPKRVHAYGVNLKILECVHNSSLSKTVNPLASNICLIEVNDR